MKQNIVRIGVSLIEGCTLPGAEHVLEAYQEMMKLDVTLSSNPSLNKEEKPQFLSTVKDLNLRLKQAVKKVKAEGDFPLILGGDHALSIGSISGVIEKDLGVLWIDAHGDCNTPESSLTQRIHGMPLATLMHQGHPELTDMVDVALEAQNILLIGVRDLDAVEVELMQKWGVRAIMMDEIRLKGFEWLMHEVMSFVEKLKVLHISFDCDSMEPSLYPGVNTDVTGGFTFEELKPLFKQLLPLEKLGSMDIVEFNPSRDQGQTAQLIEDLNQLITNLRL